MFYCVNMIFLLQQFANEDDSKIYNLYLECGTPEFGVDKWVNTAEYKYIYTTVEK